MDTRNTAEGLPKSVAETQTDAAISELRFRDFAFDLRRSELKGRDGTRVPLRPKAEALLRTFLASPGRLLGREALMQAVWPAAVVTDDSLVQCIGELRTALGDRAQRLIRTVPRRGYVFEAEVIAVPDARADVEMTTATGEAASASVGDPASGMPSAVSSQQGSRSKGVVLAGALAVLVGGLAFGLRPTSAPVRIDEEMAVRCTVAVMPFTTAATDAESRALADLLTDAVTAQFATRKGMRGLGRAATAEFAAAPLATIATELKASLLVTAQVVRTGGDRLAVDAQLLAVSGGGVLWSRHWEGAADDLVARAELGQHVVNAVRSRSVPKTLDDPAWKGASIATRQTMIGWNELDGAQTAENTRRARARFEDALRVDPESVIASNGLAATYVRELLDPASRSTPEQLANYERAVEHAREIAPDDPTALLLWGSLQVLRGRPDLAIPAVERSIAIVPSYPFAYVLLGQAKLLSGRAFEVEALAQKAIQRSAEDPKRTSAAYLVAAEAALLLGDDAAAASLAKRSIAALPSNIDAHAVLAAVDELAGRHDEAATEMAEVRRRNPHATLPSFAARRRSSDPVYLTQRTRLFDALVQAGLPSR